MKSVILEMRSIRLRNGIICERFEKNYCNLPPLTSFLAMKMASDFKSVDMFPKAYLISYLHVNFQVSAMRINGARAILVKKFYIKIVTCHVSTPVSHQP